MLRRHWAHAKASAPTLEQKHRKYFLRFTYEEQVALTQEPAERQRISTRDRYSLNRDFGICVLFHDKSNHVSKILHSPSLD